MSHKLHIPTNFDAHIPDLVMAFTVVAITAIVFTLGGYAWAAWNPVSRPHLNRVSFRLLVYALPVYAVSMIAGTRLGAGAACNFNTFASNVVLMFAGVMFASMAINLQLVLVHGVNGQKMERYYVFAALALTAACNIPPYAAGALGFWEANATCWFNSPNPAVQLRWFIGSQAFWLFLMSACEVATDHPKTTYCFVSHNNPQNRALSTDLVLFHDHGLYPRPSSSPRPEMTELNWRWCIVDMLVYALRPMVYSLLAATDFRSLFYAHYVLSGGRHRRHPSTVRLKTTRRIKLNPSGRQA
ncbi:hypothetical protein FB451DRAFT_1415363 [Mycena latifolia]|nr:hypothetical protein FB451DRAFT_1415363 [Mycena latifolia]